ncbi:MAG TPA: hypothetical protein VLF61_03350 [Rhabdochlamydiaceae bacterium]|nr:hypothetical protein [Rhabdochlamydiaceae bacterium]
MRFIRTLFLATSFLLLSEIAYADTVESGRDLEDQDIQALRDWINTKRQVSLKEIGGDLSISGEVRTEFQTAWEDRNGKSQRGPHSETGRGAQGFDIEVNLMLDYRTERTWSSIKIEFDNDAGVFNGSLGNIALERAYWGVRLVDGEKYNIDIEAGRRKMLTIFDSKVQFSSFFDGIVLRYDHAIEGIGDFYLRTGPFVVNEQVNQFAYIWEMALLNIANTGVYTKYSIVDWDTKHYAKSFVNDRFRFLVNQWIVGYRLLIKSINKVMLAYSAFLYNPLAKRLDVSDHKRANMGGYIGFSLGQLRKQWDWALDINYQVVQAQAVPDFDCSGIGLGNANKSGFYTKTLNPVDGGGASTPANAGGTTNFRGFSITFDLLLTDKLDIQQMYQQTITLDSDIGPFRRFKQYEIEFIYTW